MKVEERWKTGKAWEHLSHDVDVEGVVSNYKYVPP